METTNDSKQPTTQTSEPIPYWKPRKAVEISIVEYCGECPFSRWITDHDNEKYDHVGKGHILACMKLSQENDLPFNYVEAERRKFVREDCPLEFY